MDNQIDFNCLEITSKEDLDYRFNQYREIVPRRKHIIDPIQKFETIFKKNDDLFSVAKRQSGGFDLYYNGARVSENPADSNLLQYF